MRFWKIVLLFIARKDFVPPLYMHISTRHFHQLVHDGSLRFVQAAKLHLLSQPISQSSVAYRSGVSHRVTHWYVFIYKSILGLLPSSLCVEILKFSNLNLKVKTSNCYLHWNECSWRLQPEPHAYRPAAGSQLGHLDIWCRVWSFYCLSACGLKDCDTSWYCMFALNPESLARLPSERDFVIWMGLTWSNNSLIIIKPFMTNEVKPRADDHSNPLVKEPWPLEQWWIPSKAELHSVMKRAGK